MYHRIIVTILIIQFGLSQDTTTADQIEDPFQIVEEDTATLTALDTTLIPIPYWPLMLNWLDQANLVLPRLMAHYLECAVFNKPL